MTMKLDSVLNTFRAIGEETRLRIATLLSCGELTVSELTQILGQSQPRVSRHLKILADAGLVERHREGSWIFYRSVVSAHDASALSNDRHVSSDLQSLAQLFRDLMAGNDRIIMRDRERLEQIRQVRAATAATYFRQNAADWDRVRRLHIADDKIEAAMLDAFDQAVGGDHVDMMIDFGTGTGQILAAFASRYRKGIGFDLSRDMLSVARANLDKAGINHAQVRHGDIFALPIEGEAADVVCVHHVLHFLAEPHLAVREAARLLRPDGVVLISDFAPHELEFLRQEHAHRRLGFSDEEVAGWCAVSGLQLDETITLQPVSPQKAESADDDQKGLTVKIWLCRAPSTADKIDCTRNGNEAIRQPIDIRN
ncbi:MAG: metalloregulator ArsR/SmtB family transcription factor [Pseudomonadota bacterium]